MKPMGQKPIRFPGKTDGHFKKYGLVNWWEDNGKFENKKGDRLEVKKEIEQQLEEEVYTKDLGSEIAEMFEKLIINTEDCPPEFIKVVDDHFWELI